MNAWWNAVRESIQKATEWLHTDQDQIVDRLTQFRIAAEAEAETSVIHIETNLALALDDVCQALGLFQEDVHQILGAKAYAYAYEAPIFQHENQRDEEQAAALLARLRELPSVRAGHIVLRS